MTDLVPLLDYAQSVLALRDQLHRLRAMQLDGVRYWGGGPIQEQINSTVDCLCDDVRAAATHYPEAADWFRDKWDSA